ncbi:MAG TPA: DUF885 family protein, partial [Pyrinomonadaceae bacterium]|nr:DUF885 family protein [Pyrinomonadaceae bacterium]
MISSKTVRRALFILFSLTLLSAGCVRINERQQTEQRQSWNSYVDEFLEAYFVAHPDFAVRAGRHEFDGRLPDWSAGGIAKEVSRLRSEKERVAKFRDLNESDSFERDYLDAVIDADLFWLDSAEWPFRCPQFYADGIDPDVYVSRQYAPVSQRIVAYTRYAKAVPAALQEIRKNLRTPLPRTFVNIGQTTFGGLASFYEKEVPAIFASVKDEQLQKEFREANGAAIGAIKDLDKWFKSQEASATNTFAIGPEKFSEMLRRTEGVEVRLDELEGIGRRDLQRNLAALKEACSAYAPGVTVPDCVARANAHKPVGGPVEMARKQLEDLKAFILDKKVVTIPGTEEARVAEAPAYRRWNFAYINIPGPFEKGLPSVYYLAPPDPTWPQAQKDAYVLGQGRLLFTS